MPYLHRAPGPQKQPAPGHARGTHSSGQSFEQLRQDCLQKGVLFQDADFPANNTSLFYSERPQVSFEWKRPGVSAAGGVCKERRGWEGGHCGEAVQSEGGNGPQGTHQQAGKGTRCTQGDWLHPTPS